MKEKARKKREAIVDISRDLFAINGFENTKVEDITKAMNISKGSFYTYFKTKEEVLFEVMEKAYVEYEEILSTIDKHQDQKDIMKDFIKNNIVKKYKRKDIDVDFISDFIEVSV